MTIFISSFLEKDLVKAPLQSNPCLLPACANVKKKNG